MWFSFSNRYNTIHHTFYQGHLGKTPIFLMMNYTFISMSNIEQSSLKPGLVTKALTTVQICFIHFTVSEIRQGQVIQFDRWEIFIQIMSIFGCSLLSAYVSLRLPLWRDSTGSLKIKKLNVAFFVSRWFPDHISWSNKRCFQSSNVPKKRFTYLILVPFIWRDRYLSKS